MHLVCVRLVTLRMHTPSIVAGIDHSYSVVFRITHQLPNSTRTGLGMMLPPGSGNEATNSTGMGPAGIVSRNASRNMNGCVQGEIQLLFSCWNEATWPT